MKISLTTQFKRVSYPHLVFLVAFAIGLLTYNTYAPFTEGWWHVYARWIEMGKIPYRDFELLVPPGYPYLLWGLSKVIGDSFLTIRFVGVIVEALTALLIFRVLSGKISKPINACIALFSTQLLYSGVASVPFDYNYIAVLFSILAFERCKTYLYSGRLVVTSRSLLLLGFIVSITLLMKQTFGISTLVFTGVLIFLAADFPMKYRIRSFLIFLSGVLLLLIYTGVYLFQNNALGPAMQQVFLNSSTTKGGASHILTAWLTGLLTPDSVAGAIRYILVLIVLAILWKLLVTQKVSIKSIKFWSETHLFWLSTTFAILLLACLLLITNLSSFSRLEFTKTLLAIVRNHFFVDSTLICLTLIMLISINRLGRKEIVMPLTSISFLFGTGLSGGVSEYGIFLGVAVSLIYLVSYFGEGVLVNVVSAIFVAILIAGLLVTKVEVPYNWWSFKAPPIKEASYTAQSGLSSGLRFSKDQLEIYNEISDFVKAAKKNCGSNIYVYPAMPLFQLNANVMPPGYLANYWFDFSSKPGIDRQLGFIQNNKIDAVVYFDVPIDVVKGHSQLFQQGKDMPQELIGNILNSYLAGLGEGEIHSTRSLNGTYSVRYGPLSCAQH